MSSQAMGWTYQYSPYKGDIFMVHLAIADVVNDTHDNRFWLKVEELATKARCTDRTVQRALRRMCDDGLAELLEAGGGRGKPAVYRFLFPSVETVTPCHPSPETVTSTTGKGDNGDRHTLSLSQENPSDSVGANADDASSRKLPVVSKVSEGTYPPAFEECWRAYPRNVAKKAAYGKWRATIEKKLAAGERRGEIMANLLRATKNYAVECVDSNRPDDMILHGATFFGPTERWADYLTVPEQAAGASWPKWMNG